MHSLELQASVKEVEPGRAFNVHGSPQLLLRKRLRRSEIRRTRAPVRECDLYMQRERNQVADHQEYGSRLPSRYTPVEQEVEVEKDEDDNASNLCRAGPPS